VRSSLRARRYLSHCSHPQTPFCACSIKNSSWSLITSLTSTATRGLAANRMVASAFTISGVICVGLMAASLPHISDLHYQRREPRETGYVTLIKPASSVGDTSRLYTRQSPKL